MADWLVSNEHNAQPTVSRYVGGFTSTALSAAFGTNPGNPNDNNFPSDQVWLAEDDTIYKVSWDGLYRSTDSGANFTLLNAFSSTSANVDDRSAIGGIHFVFDSGNDITYIAGWWKNTSTALRGWRYQLTGPSPGTFSEVPGPAVFTNQHTRGNEILFGTAIHFLLAGDTGSTLLKSFDPTGSGTWSNYSLPTDAPAGANGIDYAVGPDNALYMIAYNITGASPFRHARFYKFTGTWGGGISIFNPGINTGNANANARFALFSDGTNLYAIALMDAGVGTSTGWRIYQIPAPFDGTGITGIVDGSNNDVSLPSVLRPAIDGGTASTTPFKRCVVVQDTQTTIGSLRTFLMFADGTAPGTPWSVYEWNGPSSAVAFVGSGGDVSDAVPKPLNGGDRFFTSGQKYVRITDVDPVEGGEKVEFIAYGGGTVTVRFRVAAAQQGATSQATLVAPVTGGGSLGTNEVTGVTADGTTVNSVTWDLFTDGFSPSQANVALVPEVD